MTHLVCRLVALVGFVAASVCARAQVAPGAQPSPDPASAVFADRLEVKLAEGSGAEWVDGRLVSHAGVDLADVQRWFAEADVAPLVTAVPRATLDAWHARACAVLPEHNRPGHLGLWFRLRCADAAACDRLLAALSAEPLVEHAYREHRLFPASAAPAPNGGDIPPTTPSFMAQQQAHDPSPLGHGVRQVAGILGARGRGVRMVMIEDSWMWDHEDVCKVTASSVIGAVPPIVLPEANHGLSGASIAFADRNAYGVTGVADEVEARFVWIDGNGGFVNAMALTMANSQPGDVVLVVVMILVPGLGPGSWLPFEFLQASFDVTLTATANGRHVVVPAGNGARNLDDPALLGRFDRSFRDSGALIVGASLAGAFQRAPFSNWGSRIDAHSWGDQVISCGYGTLFFPNQDPLQAYTAAATGTSSATPHIAGLVAAIQGAAKRQLDRTLSNAEVVDLLHNHGPLTPDVIGPRPDVLAILTQLGVVDGLMMQEPDVGLGDTIVGDMSGAPGAVTALFGGYATAELPVGLNRDVHLDLAQSTALGAFVLTNGAAQYQLAVPNNAVLHGLDIYFQGVRLEIGQPLHLTNSCHVTVR